MPCMSGMRACSSIRAWRYSFLAPRCCLARPRDRQCDASFQAALGSVLQDDLAAMPLHDGLSHRQPQADTACGAIARFIDPVIRTEYVIEGIRRYSGPLVLDGDDP